MSNMPNPFDFAAPQVAEKAVVSPVITPGTVDAAADNRFVLDEVAFMEAIEPLPLFLQALIDVIEVPASY
jgi:hypothetical protein